MEYGKCPGKKGMLFCPARRSHLGGRFYRAVPKNGAPLGIPAGL
jgi:hypothetical protein